MQDKINLFLGYIEVERNFSKETIKAYNQDLKLFLAFVESELGKTTWDNVDAILIRAWLSKMYDENKTSTTISRKLSTLRSFYNFMIDNKIVVENPFIDIQIKHQPNHLPHYFRQKELTKLFETVNNETNILKLRNIALIELLYGTGMRVSEVSRLTITEIDFNRDTIHVFGKGGKQRFVPLGSYAKKAINNYMTDLRLDLMVKNNQSHDFLFVNKLGKPITSGGIEYVLKQVMKETGLANEMHPHMFRHTYATDLLNNGADLRSVQELLGHENLSTTQIYTHVSKERLQADYRKYFSRAVDDNN